MCKFRRLVRISIVIFCFALSGLPALHAQETKGEEFTLEEITVTAEKRVENLQKTPIAMAVIQGADLRDTGAVSIADILKDIPNVSTSETGGMGSTINIRGLGQDMPIGVGDSSVSTNLDGTYQTRPETNIFGYFDVERVEVLKGPQGTLYGRNATGGVVNVVSVKPKTDKVEGYASVESAEYKKMKTEAAINVPISDTFAGRVSFVSLKENSFTKDNLGNRDDLNGMATRFQVRYTPNGDVAIGLLYNYVHRTGGLSGVVTQANWDAGKYDINSNSDSVYPYSRTNKSSFSDSKISANVEFPLAVGIVTFVPSYESIMARNSQYAFPGGPPPPGGKVAAFSQGGNPWSNKTSTAELRYANKSDSQVKWTTGLYWTKTDEPQTPNSVTGRNLTLADSKKTYSTKAAFAQMTYPFSDTFRGILGARYDSDEKGYFNPTFANQTPPLPISKTFTFNYFDWKAGIEKDLAKDVMSYFTLSTGHKPGGYNENNGVPFDMESDISAEIGVKSRFMDNRVQLNGAVFYYDYKGYQVIDFANVFHPATGITEPDAIFFNADKARNLGAEFDTTALIGDATMLNLNVAYLDNKYTAPFIVHPDGPFAPGVDQNGKPMPHSPKFTFKAGIDHTFYFENGDSLKPSISYRWTDKQYMGTIVIPSNLAPSYAVMDAGVTYTSAKNWTLNFYANNALNKHYYSGSVSAGPELRYFPGNPRQMGATFNLKF
jgi:iron complex outermembrane recepter protein